MDEAQRIILSICGELKIAAAAVVETRAQIERPANPMNATQVVIPSRLHGKGIASHCRPSRRGVAPDVTPVAVGQRREA
jgi:hypothetical protein